MKQFVLFTAAFFMIIGYLYGTSETSGETIVQARLANEDVVPPITLIDQPREAEARMALAEADKRGKVNPHRRLSKMPVDDPYLPNGNDQDWLIIQFFRKKDDGTPEAITGAQAGLLAVKLTNGDQDYTIEIDQERRESHIIPIYLGPLPREIGAANNDLIEASSIIQEDETIYTHEIGYFKYWDKLMLYRVAKTTTYGLHIPLNLYSGRIEPEGLKIAALPIGLAWGFKWYIRPTFHIGFIPAMANWLIYSNREDDPKGEFTLQSLTYGGYLDINNLFSLGFSYGFDFREGADNPGLMLVVGINGMLLNMLRS